MQVVGRKERRAKRSNLSLSPKFLQNEITNSNYRVKTYGGQSGNYPCRCASRLWGSASPLSVPLRGQYQSNFVLIPHPAI